jgi:DNA modification methylase
LIKNLIKTYTNEVDFILDPFMGSGVTGEACVHLNRSFIGIEMDNNYFNKAKERIENAK